MNAQFKKGVLELIVLESVRKRDMYGYELIQEMSLLSQQVFSMSQGSLYPFLHALEDRRLIQSYTQEAGGRERRYYRLTTAGQAALEEKERQWGIYTRAMERILEGAWGG